MPLNLRKSTSLLSLGAALVLPAMPAMAEADLADIGTTEVTCTGGAYQTWEPGLQLWLQPVAYTNKTSYDTCTSGDPNITSGELLVATEVKSSCVGLQGSTEATITWNDGSVSTLALFRSGVDYVHGAQAYVSIGWVMDGPFQGDAAVMMSSITPNDLTPCLSPSGLSGLSGPSSLRLIRHD